MEYSFEGESDFSNSKIIGYAEKRIKISRLASTRSAKQKANHFALAKYLENDLATEVDPNQVIIRAQLQPVKETPE
ncbi:hypothetical protein QYF36_014763 [Acer negundo]|nr:hypothetical protein QYF36_014763 [Acer negundo]